jgi:hypothetical protein
MLVDHRNQCKDPAFHVKHRAATRRGGPPPDLPRLKGENLASVTLGRGSETRPAETSLAAATSWQVSSQAGPLAEPVQSQCKRSAGCGQSSSACL